MRETASYKPFFIFTVIMVFAISAPLAYAALDQDVTDVYPTAEPTPEQMRKETAPATIEDQFELRGFADIQQGYDNNVELDPQRLADGFLQMIGNTELIYNFNEGVDVKIGADLFSTIYYTHNVNNLFDVAPYGGIDIEITPELISKNRIVYDYFSYPNDKEDSFQGLKFSTSLRYYFLDNIYQEVTAEFLTRWFKWQSTTDWDGTRSNTDRVDHRYRIQYNIGAYLDKIFLRVSNEISKNDSNDIFQCYYDQMAYRLRPALMYFFTDEIYADVGLTYRYARFKDRRSTEDINEKVRNHVFIFNASAYYDITRNVTLGVTYSYSENTSNDPYERYSGSVFSGGLYYSF